MRQDRVAPERAKATKLEETLQGLQNQLFEHYCMTGKQLIEVAQAEKETIDQLVDEIIRVRKQLATVRKEKICTHCEAPNDQDSNFCKRCGQPIEKEATL